MNQQTEQTRNGEIQAELLRISHRAPLIAPLLNVPVAAAVAVMFADKVPDAKLIVWLTWVTLAVSLRVGYLLYFRAKQPVDPCAPRWRLWLTLTVGFFGASWGASAFLLFVPGSFQMHVTLAAIVSVATIFMTLTAAYLPAFYAYAVGAMVPQIFLFLTQGTTNHTMTGLALIMLMLMTSAVASARKNTFRELTSLRLQVADEKELAEQANRAKSKFLAAASHDLRQPLHAIALFSGTLSSRLRNADNKAIVASMDNAVYALESLLNALLDISKLDAGAVDPEKADFPLAPMIGRLIHELSPEAQSKGLVLDSEGDSVAAHGDSAMTETILRNLLSNAIRYTAQGSVMLKCRVEGNHVVISVADTGVGIAKEHQQEIFREFHQLHNPERDRTKGLGLGLAIVDRLVRLLGYELTLVSEPGQGTTFSVRLPLGASPAAGHELVAATETAALELAPIRILLVDDEKLVRESTRMLLESWGMEVDAAEGAEEALQLIASSGRHPDAVIADLRLREGQAGTQVIEQVCALVGREIPSVIITGDIAQSRLKQAREGGYTVLHKPVSPARLRMFVRSAQQAPRKA
ncbi:MAG: ATP-binding protein [Hylemonella sp.]|nr:ATP-binding protein [Hylemonella sp.]